MEGRARFPDLLINKVRSESFDGRSMVDTCKSILQVDYNDEEYENYFFGVFNLLVDEGSERGADYNKIEALYKNSFLEALVAFRSFYDI